MVLDPNDPNMMYGQPMPGLFGQPQMGGITSIIPPAPTEQPKQQQPVPTPFTPPPTANPMAQPGMSIIPPAPGTVPSLFGASTPAASTFSPSNNLISTQITPSAPDPQGYLKQAAGDIGSAKLGPLAGDVGQARGAALQGLTELKGAPSRSQTASSLYGALEKLDRAGEAKDVRGVGQRNAAMGRLGSGMVNDELSDVYGEHDARLASIKAQLAYDTAGAERGDTLNEINAAQGLTQGLGGLDLSRESTGAGLALDRGNALGSLEGRRYGEEMGGLDFTRGERDYQHGLDREATDDAVRRKMLEDDLLNSDYNRKAKTATLAGEYGFGSSPTGLSLANLYGGQAGDTQSAIMQLLYNQGAR
jgi:hypothetical protein